MALAAAGVTPRVAVAHGGVPISTGVSYFSRNGQAQPALETNFGLLLRDDHNDWRLICEETYSLGAKYFKVWPDGELGMGAAEGYLFSNDGCTFQLASGVSSGVRGLDTAVTESGALPVLVLLTEEETPGWNVVRSLDRGRSFERVAVYEDLRVNSLRADAATPGRLLATAQDLSGARWLLVSEHDAWLNPTASAETIWTKQRLPFETGIARVLAGTSSGTFLRHIVDSEYSLWRTTDGGESFQKVLPVANELKAAVEFVRETAPGQLWASSGVDQAFRSSDGGQTWQQEPAVGALTCLGTDGSALHACLANTAGSEALRVSRDGGRSWSTELKYSQVAGIKQCPLGSSVYKACDPLWNQIAFTFKGDQAQPAPPPVTSDDGGCATASVPPAVVTLLLLRRRRHR